MRIVGAVALFACLGLHAQVVPRVGAEQVWRQNLSGMLGRPPGTASLRDVEQMRQYLVAATPYCSGLTYNDYLVNQALMRNMYGYLGAMNARDPETRAAIAAVSRSIAVFPCAAKPAQPENAQSGPPRAEPNFSLQAPALENISAADKETARELTARYETDAAYAAVAWNNAETMKQSLAKQGMGLNVQTATSVGRFKLFLDQAAGALREHNWEDPLSSLQAVESETQKVAKVVGK